MIILYENEIIDIFGCQIEKEGTYILLWLSVNYITTSG